MSRYDLRPVPCANCGKTAWVKADNSELRLCTWCDKKIKRLSERYEKKRGGGRSESTHRKK